ncbi:MAG: phosphatase PAP2 family protein [Candidatus Binatia bacterium]|nr:phosphatase PAP2 family protein [Candidatus Binatia bacterium]
MSQGLDLAIEPGAERSSEGLRSYLTGASAWTWRCLALVGVYVAVGYAAALFLGLPLHWPIAHLVAQIQLVAVVAYGSLALAYALDRSIGPRVRLGDLAARLLSPRIFFEFVAAMVAVHVTLVVFVNLKQYVPALNPTLYDSPLWRLDAWLHFGVEPAVWATEFAAEYGLLPFLDHAYLVFFPVQLLVPLLFLFSTRLRPVRGTFFFAYCLLWMFGSLIYIVWPALGPIYYWPSRFVWLDLAPYAQHLQWTLIQDYAQFRSGPEYYAVKLYYGVAALPSLHVGMFTLFALATWRWRGMSAVLWVLTAITFAGSLALGWHYAVDGYAGAFMAWGAWRIGRLMAPQTES